ncbi:MAG: hypothetical protein WAQ28_16430 [Bacteroidia bacterium]
MAKLGRGDISNASVSVIRGKFLHVSGSANPSCDLRLLVRARDFVSNLGKQWLSKGGGLVVFLGKEPRIQDADPATSLTFDWLILEVIDEFVRSGDATSEQAVAILSSESHKRRFREERVELVEALTRSGNLSLEFLDEER